MFPRLVPIFALVILLPLSGCLSAVAGGGVQESAPAEIDPAALEAAQYVEVNRTSPVVTPRLPIVGESVSVRTWVVTYASVEGMATGALGGPPRDGPSGDTPSFDAPQNDAASASRGAGLEAENVSVVVLVSTSAVEVGPIALNPVAYAADPALLERTNVLVEVVAPLLPGEVADLSVEGSEPVTMLGSETTVTTLSGRVVSPEGESSTVSIAVTRVIHGGDVVVAVGLSPGNRDDAGDLAALAPHVVHRSDG